MQEQHHYKATPELGWSGMLRVLDQAMPVAQRQRRFSLFWWAAAAVSSAAIIAAFVLLNDSDMQLPSVSQHDVESKSGIEHTQEISTRDNSPSVVATEENVAQTQLDNTAVIGPVDTYKKGDIQKNRHPIQNTVSPRSSMVMATGENKTQSETVFIEEEEVNLNSQVIAGIEPIESSSKDIVLSPLDQFRLNETIATLPLPELDALAHETELMMNIEPGTISRVNSKRNLITPHVAAGVIQGFQNGIGVQGAIGADIHILPRLSVTADVGYNIYSPDASLFGCVCDDENFIDNNDVLRDDLGYHGIGEYIPAETVFKASGGSLNSFVSTIRQWQLSAGLKYDLSRRFYAQGGVALGFGTTAHSAYPIIAFNNSTPLNADLLTISHSFKNVIKSGSTSFYAGVGYKLSPRIELYANATHSFDHYFQNNNQSYTVESPDREDYIRGMNFGLKYNFQGP